MPRVGLAGFVSSRCVLGKGRVVDDRFSIICESVGLVLSQFVGRYPVAVSVFDDGFTVHVIRDVVFNRLDLDGHNTQIGILAKNQPKRYSTEWAFWYHHQRLTTPQ